jgi:hypothetical protein
MWNFWFWTRIIFVTISGVVWRMSSVECYITNTWDSSDLYLVECGSKHWQSW